LPRSRQRAARLSITAAILGCGGLALSPAEREFFRAARPAGFILFGRNCGSPDQVRRLVRTLRQCTGRADAPVLIDQEGGRVARLRPPHWRLPPAAAVFGALYARNPMAALTACRLNARLIAAELARLGITVDCAPVLDIPVPGSHDIVGDRALARDPAVVAMLARAWCEGFRAGGVAPVIKHIPGHGRACADSHETLPVVEVSRADLASDFAPFAALADQPWAMTAHVLYPALDAEEPATTSPTIIADVIRGELAFRGVLLSDDLSMKALSGTLEERARRCRAAGCDIALHCNGNLDEMKAVARGAGALKGRSLARFEQALAWSRSGGARERFDPAQAEARLAALLQPIA
jgi:beta-N-acetylhexosaminidase